MKFLWILIFCLNFVHNRAQDVDDETLQEPLTETDEHNAEVAENRLAMQINAVLEHYKQENPIGFPGAPIPDPMDVPDIKTSVTMVNLVMRNVKVHGMSKFRIESIKADLNAMKVDAVIVIDELLIKGDYKLKALFSNADGPFTVAPKMLKIKGIATLSVQRDGRLETDGIQIDVTFAEMQMDFQRLGLMGSIFQNILNSAPNLVFDTIKPFMLKEADTKLRTDINQHIEKLMKDQRLPNSITPLDMAIAEVRKKVRDMGYDPYHLPDYNRTTGIFGVYLDHTWISGISSFYRVGNVIVSMENNTLQLRVDIGTQRISGAGQWQVSFGLMSRYGHVKFTVEFIKLSISLIQPLDTRKRLKMNDLQIDMGNIQVRCKGAGTMDYVMEMLVNILPNLLRYQIMSAIENPVKMRIQEKFDAVDVEAFIKENASKFQTGDFSMPIDFKF